MSRETQIVYAVCMAAIVWVAGWFIWQNHEAVKSLASEVSVLNEQCAELNEKVAEIGKESPIAIDNVSCIMPIGEYRVSHYCACKQCCGKDNGITASGTMATAGRTIAMEGVPIGTTVYIEALGEFRVVEDRFGNPNKTDCIDIFVDSHEEAINKGVYKSQVYIVVKGD